MQVRIRPALLRAWRAPGRLQVGLDPARGVVLDGLTGAEEALLDALETGVRPGDVPALAARTGLPEVRARELLAALSDRGLVGAADHGAALPAPARRRLEPDARVLDLTSPSGGWAVLAARRRAAVVVAGASRTGLAVALGLAAAGVGRVVVEDDALVAPADVLAGGYGEVDVGRARSEAATRLLAARLAGASGGATAAGPRAAAGDGEPPDLPDLVVLVAGGALDPARTEALVREGVVHLPVVWREDRTVVGPLVRPGESTCVRCVDEHRTDRDPHWPRVLAQLAAAPPGGTARPEEASLATLTAALAVAQVLAELDGTAAPTALDATVETALPTCAVAVRPWSPHPRCGCTWQPTDAVERAVGGAVAGAVGHATRGSVSAGGVDG